MIADGIHARADGHVTGGIIASAAFIAVGLPIADPIIGLLITGLIYHSTWESWKTIRRGWPPALLPEQGSVGALKGCGHEWALVGCRGSPGAVSGARKLLAHLRGSEDLDPIDPVRHHQHRRLV